MDLIDFPLPQQVEELLIAGTSEKVALGDSDSHVFRFHCLDGEVIYLKMTKTTSDVSLKTEVERLSWLANHIKVPGVIHFEEYEGYAYLLMSSVEGVPSFMATKDREQTIKECARGLLDLHAIPLTLCPFDNRLGKKIAEARSRVEKKIVDESDFDPKRIGKTAVEIFAQVLADRPKDEDLVVAHGDYCMPNIIIKDGRLSGFIDVERVGIADRYQDLALAARSIERNFSKESVDLFMSEYGVTPDTEKIEYYQLLDELF